MKKHPTQILKGPYYPRRRVRAANAVRAIVLGALTGGLLMFRRWLSNDEKEVK